MSEQGLEALAQLSDGLAAAAERGARSTVQVNARRRLPASGVVWSADGVIVTADHVLEREVAQFEDASSDEDITEKLRWLGYIS